MSRAGVVGSVLGLLGGVLLAGLAPAQAPAQARAGAGSGEEVLFAFADPEISEASGLTPLPGGLFATTNDSGDSGRVFTVSSAGKTVGLTHWAADPVDVEGLAPAGRRHVWVGDIGDNSASRGSITIARVPVGAGERTVSPATYELVYPDGAHNAETLLAHPDGQVFVATKEFGGGRLYAAPKRLDPDRPNRLTEVAPVLPMATDGAFFRDGKHLVVRGYFSATVYAWPSMDRLGSFRTPDQEQGEAIGTTAAGDLVVTSEGLHAEVIKVDRARVDEASGAAGSSPGASSPGSSSPGSSSPGASASGAPGGSGGAAGSGSGRDDGGRASVDADDDAEDDPGTSPLGPIALVAVAVVAYLLLRKPKHP